ncbi:MAG TPA: hypothetical protein VLM38_24845 [Blastocatellia bacterium]|nr:hypothetical protein [Blastocatellia bacterium]
MSLATYDEARPWAKAIKEEVLERRMPPWRAARGYGEFRNAMVLPQHDIDLLVNWVEGGAPKGDDKDLPSGPLFSTDWQMGKPDLILKPESESKVAGDADEYRDFLLPTNLKEARWLTAVDLRPGAASVVHCATLYLVKAETTAEAPPAMLQVKSDDSVASSSAAFQNAAVLGTWMPGQKTIALGGGVAQALPAGSRLGVRIHYRGSAEENKDLSSVGLYFAKALPKKQLQELAITNREALIPMGAELQHINLSLTTLSDSEAVAIRPNVHPLLVSLQATAYRPDGSQEVLIWARGYQSDWAPTYYFKQPVALPRGTRVEVIAYFDNSEDNQNNRHPAKSVRWSELRPTPLCVLLVANPASVSGQPGAR